MGGSRLIFQMGTKKTKDKDMEETKRSLERIINNRFESGSTRWKAIFLILGLIFFIWGLLEPSWIRMVGGLLSIVWSAIIQ